MGDIIGTIFWYLLLLYVVHVADLLVIVGALLIHRKRDGAFRPSHLAKAVIYVGGYNLVIYLFQCVDGGIPVYAVAMYAMTVGWGLMCMRGSRKLQKACLPVAVVFQLGMAMLWGNVERAESFEAKWSIEEPIVNLYDGKLQEAKVELVFGPQSEYRYTLYSNKFAEYLRGRGSDKVPIRVGVTYVWSETHSYPGPLIDGRYFSSSLQPGTDRFPPWPRYDFGIRDFSQKTMHEMFQESQKQQATKP